MNTKKQTIRFETKFLVATVMAMALIMAIWTFTATTRRVEAASTSHSGVNVPFPVGTAPTEISTATPEGTNTPGTTGTPGVTNTPGVPTPVPTGVPALCLITYTDVSVEDWFYEPVRWISCNRIANGYNDNTFRPANNATRAQIAKMIVLASGWTFSNPPNPTFSDVAPGSTFFSYIETAFTHGIIVGYDDGTFHPNADVTRGQLCKMTILARRWTLSLPSTATFRDVPVGSTFFQYIETAASKNVVNGYSDDTFHPSANATRAQLSKIIQRAFTMP